MILTNNQEQKIDLYIEDLLINLEPSIIKTFSRLLNSITQLQAQVF